MVYVLLAAGGLLLGGWVIYSRRDAVALAVFWVAGAIVFTANYAVLDLLELYHYRPGLLPTLIPDTVMGVFLAELGFVAGWAVWIVYRLPPWSGAIFGTVVVVLLEVLFRRMGVFVGRWWQLWHTAVVFPPYFLLVWLFRRLAEAAGVARGWARTVVRVSLALWWSHFFGMVAYWVTAGVMMQVRLLPTFARNQTLGAILTVGPFLIAAMLWVMPARGAQRALRLGWSAAGLLLIGQFWAAVGLWHFRAPWNLYVHTAGQVATIYLTTRTDDWIGRWAEAEAESGAGAEAGGPLRTR